MDLHIETAEVLDRLPGSHISTFSANDLAELVVLQRCCWVQEALLNDTLDIPALRESHAEVLDWAQSWTTLTTRSNGRLVAAVRGRSEGPRWHVGRLMVAPDLAGTGIGSALLRVIEGLAPPQTSEFVLFTGRKSERNIRFYQRAGYRILDASDVDVTNHIHGAVYLSKSRAHETSSEAAASPR